MTKVFIDGSVGTTGLRIWERLAQRKDLELLSIPARQREDPNGIEVENQPKGIRENFQN